MSEAFWGYFLAVSALVLFTVAIITTKLASSRIELGMGFLISTSTNVAFSGLVFGVQWLLHTRGVPWAWNWHAFGLFALSGVFSTYLGRWFFYESVVRFGPSKASIFQVSSPLFTAMIAWLVLGEALTPIVAGGMLMTVLGLMTVSYKPGFFSKRTVAATVPAVTEDIPVAVAPQKSALHQRLLQSFLLLGLGSSLAYAIGSVLRGSAVRSWNEPILGALVGAVCGLALHLVFSSGKREMLARWGSTSRSGIWMYVVIGVATISAQTCVIAAMRFIPLSVATLVTLCTPLLVFPISRWLFKNQEDITVITLLGGALTLAGILVIVLR